MTLLGQNPLIVINRSLDLAKNLTLLQSPLTDLGLNHILDLLRVENPLVLYLLRRHVVRLVVTLDLAALEAQYLILRDP